MAEIAWPMGWQDDAKASVERFFGVDQRLRIVVGDPAAAIDGTVIEGYAYVDGCIPTMSHDRSERPDVHPWKLLSGPVLRMFALRPRQNR